MSKIKIQSRLIGYVLLLMMAALGAPEVRADQTDFDLLLQGPKTVNPVIVQEVISADTIVVEDYTRKGTRIRLIGLKAPKPPKRKRGAPERDKHGFVVEPPVDPVTRIEQESFEFAKRLLINKEVRLEYDVNKKGPDFETLAYVFLVDDDTFVNAEILRRGFADIQFTPRNHKYADELREAYQEARQNRRGLQGR
jgi:micrococcal nuclease